MMRSICSSTVLRCAVFLALGAAVAGCAKAAKEAKMQEPKGQQAEAAKKGELYATFVTSKGDIVVKLFPKEAPKTVENFVGLATGKKRWIDPKTRKESSRPLYSGTIFHRIIPGFMIQGGDPLGTGTGGPGYRFADEFYPGRAFGKQGILAMANSGPNTNGSQFFITLAPTPWLNNRHTIFGEVVGGQKVVKALGAVQRGAGDRPIETQVLKEIRIEAK